MIRQFEVALDTAVKAHATAMLRVEQHEQMQRDLWPNHHAVLNRHGWFLTDELGAIETVSGMHLGSIIKADSHSISISCIRYQRRFALSCLKSSLKEE